MPGARWFPDVRAEPRRARLPRPQGRRDTAIIAAGELGEPYEITWRELRALTAALAAGLRERGVGRGDRVVAYMPNIPETIAAFLAVASLGAIWSSCSPDFGARSVVDRFAQIEPKVLLAVDGYRYGGRDFDKLDVVAELAARDADARDARSCCRTWTRARTLGRLENAIAWDELLELRARRELEFERVPFDHPLWVLYSSGTTGLPKAIVQGHGGILLEHLKKLHLHLDARPGDRVFWFTTTGWMMWNFLVGVLLTEAAIVLYDGNPGHPDLGRLWDLAEQTQMTCFGTSASYIASCMKAGVKPAQGRDARTSCAASGRPARRSRRRAFAGSPTSSASDVWLFSTSGGTDVCTAFVGGVPTLPVHQGELQARALGAAVAAFDEDGRRARSARSASS